MKQRNPLSSISIVFFVAIVATTLWIDAFAAPTSLYSSV